MSRTLTLHFNDSLPAMGERFVDAWHRAEAGGDVDETHVGFVDLQSMLSALTPRLMELLRALHAHPAKDAMALSRALGRDYETRARGRKCAQRGGAGKPGLARRARAV